MFRKAAAAAAIGLLAVVLAARIGQAAQVLTFSTYLGGSKYDDFDTVAVDASGNTWVAGATASSDFPTLGAIDASSGPNDVVLVRIGATGALAYATYLAGVKDDVVYGLAVDAAGAPVVTGRTFSSDFPVFAAEQPSFGGIADVFVSKLRPDGQAFVFSTYLGGSEDDIGDAVAFDPAGNVYVGGSTYSANFPVRGPIQGRGGSIDAFVARLDPGGALGYSTFLGGFDADFVKCIAADASGSAYIAGGTYSSNFPTRLPYQPSIGGLDDAFVARLAPDGSSLLVSTYLGGSDGDRALGLALGRDGTVLVAGETRSTGFPVVAPLQPANAGGTDVFVAGLDPSSLIPRWSTYLGGKSTDGPGGLAVDALGRAVVVGSTISSDFPRVAALQPFNPSQVYDAFVARIAGDGSALDFSTYLGGSQRDTGWAVAVDATCGIHVAGSTESSDFPTVLPIQAALAGSGDAIVVTIAEPGACALPGGLGNTLKVVREGAALHLTWGDAAGAALYRVLQDDARGGPFAGLLGESSDGAVGLLAAPPAGDFLLFSAVGVSCCGEGPR